MDDDFTQLFEFYERCGPDASGHGFMELEHDDAALIERFMDGRCNPAERRKVVEFLQANPQLIRQIADRIKAARQDSDG